MSEENLPTEALVSAYLKLRDEIQKREEEHKQEIATLREQFDMVAARLLDVCNDLNADSIKTPNGTISRRVQSRYWTSDWDAMREFVREHDAFDVLEKRINSNNMRVFLEENPELFPVGLQCDKKFVVQVRKPTNK